APGEEAVAREVRADVRRPLPARHRADQEVPGRRGEEPQGDRRGGARPRVHPRAEDPADREGVLRQGAQPVGEPRRGGGDPRGVPQIEVTSDIDANGIVHVAAKDRATGKENKITITATSGLSKDDIEKAVKDAQAHEAEDKERREEIEVRNKADSLAYATEKS